MEPDKPDAPEMHLFGDGRNPRKVYFAFIENLRRHGLDDVADEHTRRLADCVAVAPGDPLKQYAIETLVAMDTLPLVAADPALRPFLDPEIFVAPPMQPGHRVPEGDSATERLTAALKAMRLAGRTEVADRLETEWMSITDENEGRQLYERIRFATERLNLLLVDPDLKRFVPAKPKPTAN